MAISSTRQKALQNQSSRFSFMQRLKEIDMFFQKKDRVHQTMRRAARRLEKAKIPYAVLGGMALNAHRYERTTKDVNILLNRPGFEAFCKKFVGKSYDPVLGRRRRFRDRLSGVTMDVLVTGLFPGTGKPGPIAFPEPKSVRQEIGDFQFVNLPTLVELKLAARRWRDFADVVELIRFNNLDESFMEKLHPSERPDFVECLKKKQREDEYESRQDGPS